MKPSHAFTRQQQLDFAKAKAAENARLAKVNKVATPLRDRLRPIQRGAEGVRLMANRLRDKSLELHHRLQSLKREQQEMEAEGVKDEGLAMSIAEMAREKEQTDAEAEVMSARWTEQARLIERCERYIDERINDMEASQ